jgi:hypothetical protein
MAVLNTLAWRRTWPTLGSDAPAWRDGTVTWTRAGLPIMVPSPNRVDVREKG